MTGGHLIFRHPDIFCSLGIGGGSLWGCAIPKTMGFPTENKQCNLRWFIIFKGLEMVWSKECWVGGGWKRRMTCGTNGGYHQKKWGTVYIPQGQGDCRSACLSSKFSNDLKRQGQNTGDIANEVFLAVS